MLLTSNVSDLPTNDETKAVFPPPPPGVSQVALQVSGSQQIPFACRDTQ